MTPQEVSELVEALPGVKRKGTTEQPAWYVRDRLVARRADDVRVQGGGRVSPSPRCRRRTPRR